MKKMQIYLHVGNRTVNWSLQLGPHYTKRQYIKDRNLHRKTLKVGHKESSFMNTKRTAVIRRDIYKCNEVFALGRGRGGFVLMFIYSDQTKYPKPLQLNIYPGENQEWVKLK